MSTAKYLIHTDLTADTNNKIITYDTRTYDAVRQQIDLFFKVNTGEVPFSTFGNNMIAQLFYVNNEDTANSIMSNIMVNMTSFLQRNGIQIVDYSVEVDRVNRKIKLTLNLADGSEIVTNI